MKTCSFDGCGEPHYARGYCSHHYQKVRHQIGFGPTCSIEGCESPAIAKELCNTHYKRKRKTGSTEPAHDDPKTRTHKACNRCKEVVPLSAFHIDRSRADGRVGVCIMCKTTYGPSIPPQMRTVKKCAKCQQVKPLDDFATDTSRLDGKTSRCIKCRQEDSRFFEQTHSDARQARSSEWARQNPDKSRARNYKRRARLNQVPTFYITDRDMRRIYEAACFICGSTNRPTFDHRIPLSLGGTHGVGNALTLCLSCNSKKRDRLLADFRYRS
jgi:5-methylcytosine-specific restriction endonuclease McrA